MKKYLLIPFFGILLLSCKKNSKTMMDHIVVDSLNYVKTPKDFGSNSIYAKINALNEVFGYASYDYGSSYYYKNIFYTNDNFVTYAFVNDLSEEYTSKIVFQDGLNVIYYKRYAYDNTIFKSTNGGKSYTEYILVDGSSSSVTQPFFLNENLGFYLAENSLGSAMQLHKLSNGSDVVVSTLPFSYYHLLSVSFLNETIGYAIVSLDSYSDEIRTLKTTNGGVTWSLQSDFDMSTLNYSGYYVSSNFKVLSEDIIVAEDYESEAYFISRNSGLTWDYVELDDKIKSTGSSYINSINFQFVTKDVGYATAKINNYNYGYSSSNSEGYLYKTVDGGETWNKISNKKIYVGNIFFLNENVGLVSANGIIQKTTDGGKKFELLMYPK